MVEYEEGDLKGDLKIVGRAASLPWWMKCGFAFK